MAIYYMTTLNLTVIPVHNKGEVFIDLKKKLCIILNLIFKK